MGPSIASRGKPRPLLAGVFRKACDYCVRSKRGCNGGTPCEQCIRRGHGCTYSQRRKSGPRGRPLRAAQQAAGISAPPPATTTIGTRTSARRTSKRMASSPSPSRTASMSSSSSEFSEVGDDEEASLDDASDMEVEQQQLKQRTLHAHKKSKISREETAAGGQGSSPTPTGGGNDDEQPHPAAWSSPFVAKQAGPRTRGDAAVAAADAAAGAGARTTAVEEDDVVEPPKLTLAASSSSFLDEPASYLSKNRIISGDRAVPPRQHSPLTVGAPPLTLQLQRSSSLPTWARETSIDAEQRRQHAQHRSSASVGTVPTSSNSGGGGSSSSSSNRGEEVHEITMQPWESARPHRQVTLVNMASQLQQQRQEALAHQAPAFAVASARIYASRHSAQQSLPPADPMDVPGKQAAAVAAAVPTATLAASMMLDGDFAGAALKDLDEEDDFAHCPWRIPSLTREQSLARVVAALGAEQGASAQQGVGAGFEGSGVTAW